MFVFLNSTSHYFLLLLLRCRVLCKRLNHLKLRIGVSRKAILPIYFTTITNTHTLPSAFSTPYAIISHYKVEI